MCKMGSFSTELLHKKRKYRWPQLYSQKLKFLKFCVNYTLLHEEIHHRFYFEKLYTCYFLLLNDVK